MAEFWEKWCHHYIPLPADPARSLIADFAWEITQHAPHVSPRCKSGLMESVEFYQLAEVLKD
jgi:hypothetical protein